MSEELRECPFCGGTHSINVINFFTGDSFRKCDICGAEAPEVLAAKLVYHDEAHEIAFSVVIRGKEQRMGHECWRSTIIPGACWAEYDRAYAATVARLKEVAE